MSANAEAALRRTVEAMVDREVEHLRRLLELRLTSIAREIVIDRLPMPERRPFADGVANGLHRDSPAVGTGRVAAPFGDDPTRVDAEADLPRSP